ncbi:hypothetical protein MTO96_008577 [Rhipicephalus appendiculatus]
MNFVQKGSSETTPQTYGLTRTSRSERVPEIAWECDWASKPPRWPCFMQSASHTLCAQTKQRFLWISLKDMASYPSSDITVGVRKRAATNK